MESHTPAPWIVKKGCGPDGEILHLYIEPKHATGCFRGSVCMVSDAEHIDGITCAERDANARLICAAPDMLYALQVALEFIEEFEDVEDGSYGEQVSNPAMVIGNELRGVIRKAGGEV
jgi:hypothetical protein